MKKLIFIILPIILTGCFCFDRIPKMEITIDKTAINEIDSLELLTGDNRFDSVNSIITSVTNDNNKYVFKGVGGRIIKLKLKDKEEIKSKVNYWGKIKISKKNNTFLFEKINTPETFRMIRYYLITFLIIFIIKVLVSLFIISPEKNINFIISFGLLNLFYYVIYEVFSKLLWDYEYSLYYFFYLVILFIDLAFLTIKYGGKGKLRPILAGLISNILFFTLGQFLISINMIL